jgi:RNA polymerase sigma factor (sigma-70 family)
VFASLPWYVCPETKFTAMENVCKNQYDNFTDTNADLIDACRKGDQQAQFRVYRLYYKAMYNISLRIVHDTMTAEDIMQESFLTAFERINTFSGKVSFGAWLKKIVKNKSIDYVKKKEIVEYFHSDRIMSDIHIPAEPEYSSEEQDPRVRSIYSAIRSLPEKYREILSLHLLEGYDNEEISYILSLPASTLRCRYSRGRSIVRRQLSSL